MPIHNAHARTLVAEPDAVGEPLDSLPPDDDRLSPVDKWPTMPMRFDRPLGVGAGHGTIRYALLDREWAAAQAATPASRSDAAAGSASNRSA